MQPGQQLISESNSPLSSQSNEVIIEPVSADYPVCGSALPCGHSSQGVRGSSRQLPCLKSECQHTHNLINSDEEELCGICFSTALKDEACVRLKLCYLRLTCRHVFHANCVAQMLTHGHSTLKISFGYLDCPSCKQPIGLQDQVPLLSQLLSEQAFFKLQFESLCVERARLEGLDKEGPVV